MLSCIDLAQSLAIIRINQAELEFRHARELVPRLLNLRRVKAGNLDKNPIGADWTDNRFADSKNVDTLPNHLHGLIEHSFGDRLVAGHEPDQERRAPLNIEAERDLFLRGPDGGDAENHKQQHQCHCQEAFPRPLIGSEVPTEKDEHREPDKKCKCGSHSDLSVQLISSLSARS